MNNENKYLFINNLPKEYHKILWDIMISSESDKELEVILKKHDSKLIMRYLFKKEKEIERLNNIINKLEKWLEEKSNVDYRCSDRIVHEQIALSVALHKLQDLKRS